MAHPRPNSDPVLRQRQPQQQPHRTRSLQLLALSAPSLGSIGHRRHSPESRHQAAGLVQRHERGRSERRSDVGDGGHGEDEHEHEGVDGRGEGVDGDLVGAVEVLGF